MTNYELKLEDANYINTLWISKLKRSLNIKNLMEQKKQIILYGPPGTGKTYDTKKIAIKLIT